MSRGRPAVGRRLACALCLLALSGCTGTDVRPVVNDPLLGPGAGTPVSRSVPTAPGNGVMSAAGGSGIGNELQELPAPSRPRLTAADLAAGANQTLDPAPTLRIGTPTLPKSAVEPGPGMTLQPPIPITDTRTLPPARGPIDGPGQLLDTLKQRGVTTRGPDKTASGEYRFLCLVPDRQDPKKFYRYEATAAGDAASSIRAVLDQMQRDGR
jgi:hypothetical protein